MNEPEKSVKLSIASLVGHLAKHEFKKSPGSWTELSGLLQTLVGSQDPVQRLLGMYTMAVLCETAGQEIKPLFGQMIKV